MKLESAVCGTAFVKNPGWPGVSTMGPCRSDSGHPAVSRLILYEGVVNRKRVVGAVDRRAQTPSATVGAPWWYRPSSESRSILEYSRDPGWPRNLSPNGTSRVERRVFSPSRSPAGSIATHTDHCPRPGLSHRMARVIVASQSGGGSICSVLPTFKADRGVSAASASRRRWPLPARCGGTVSIFRPPGRRNGWGPPPPGSLRAVSCRSFRSGRRSRPR